MVVCFIAFGWIHLSTPLVILFFFFFFLAADGIRDYKVTGVQTCALPLSSSSWAHWPHVVMWRASSYGVCVLRSSSESVRITGCSSAGRIADTLVQGQDLYGVKSARRSEERRVGDESNLLKVVARTTRHIT